MKISRHHWLEILLLANALVSLLHYFDYLRLTESVASSGTAGFQGIDLLNLVMTPVALLGLCLMWSGKATFSAMMLSIYAGMSLLALHLSGAVVHAAPAEMVLRHQQLSWLQVYANLSLLVVVLPRVIANWMRRGARAARILQEARVLYDQSANVPAAVQMDAALTYSGYSEYDHANAMDDPARIHRHAA